MTRSPIELLWTAKKRIQQQKQYLEQETRPVPIFCNQWGVKNLVSENLGRRQYVRDLANLFEVGKRALLSLLNISHFLRNTGSTPPIGYGGPTTKTSGLDLKWFVPTKLACLLACLEQTCIYHFVIGLSLHEPS